MNASPRLAAAALLLAGACGSSQPDGERFVLRTTWLSECPTAQPICVEGSKARDNGITATVELGELVDAQRVSETWLRVRKEDGKVGYLPLAYASPAGAAQAVATEAAACYPGRFFGSALEKTLNPGKLLYVERHRFGRWRLPLEPDCPWVKDDALSEDAADLTLAVILAKIPGAKTSEVAGLLEKARLLAPGTQLKDVVTAADAKVPRPQAWSPRPLEPGEVAASKAPADACDGKAGLPVPEEYAGSYAGDPAALEIRPARTSGMYASVAPRTAVDWSPHVAKACTWIDLDHPVSEAQARTTGRTIADCFFDAPEAEGGGRWYLAVATGVYAAKVAGIGAHVSTPVTGTNDIRADLLLRPAPGGGSGFAFWSPASRGFRACALAIPQGDSKEAGIRSEAQDGKLAVLEGEPGTARRAVVDRRPAPIAAAYKLEALPGGAYLFLALSDGSPDALGACQPSLLLRWADLVEVARVDCVPLR